MAHTPAPALDSDDALIAGIHAAVAAGTMTLFDPSSVPVWGTFFSN